MNWIRRKRKKIFPDREQASGAVASGPGGLPGLFRQRAVGWEQEGGAEGGAAGVLPRPLLVGGELDVDAPVVELGDHLPNVGVLATGGVLAVGLRLVFAFEGVAGSLRGGDVGLLYAF
jgi:hypothetical protein